MTDRHDDLVQELAALMRNGEDSAATDAVLSRVAPEHREAVRAEAHRQAAAGTEHEGALEEEVGDTRGPGPGFDDEPETIRNKGGVSSS
jgi:hypothetical protein